MAVHHAVGISRQRNSGYRPSRINIMAQGLSTPDPSLSPTHLSIRRGRATTTHYTHHHISLMVSRNTTLVSSLGLRIVPAYEAGLSAGMRRERVPSQIRKRKKEELLEDEKWMILRSFVSTQHTGLWQTDGRTDGHAPLCIHVFHHWVYPHHSSFPVPHLMAIFRRGRPLVPNGGVECKGMGNCNFWPIFRLSRKWYNIGPQLLWNANRNSYVGYRILGSVISNDLEWPLIQISRSRHYLTLNHSLSASFI